MKKKSFILVLGLLFTKVFGIARELALGNLYGPGVISDAYIISSNIPNVIFGFVSSGLVTTFIPIYSKVYNRDGDTAANKFMTNTLNILVAMSFVLAIFGFVFADYAVSIFAGGFSSEAKLLAVSFVRITIFSIVFTAIKSIMEGYLQINQMFNIAPINGFLMNVVFITSIVVSYITGKPMIMALGVLIAALVQSGMTYYFSKKFKYKHDLSIDLKDENMYAMIKMGAPIIIGSSIDQINKIVDSSIASSIMVGGVSTLNFAVKISDSILGIFVGAIATVMYPSLSNQAAQGKIEELKITVNKMMSTVLLLIVPASVGLMILSYPVLNILYGRKFTPDQLTLTSNALVFYTLGSVAFGLRQLLVRTFYALHDSITPVISGVVSISINIVLNFVLSKYLGLPGLALATSIAAITSVFFLYLALKRKIGSMDGTKFVITFVKILVASLIMGCFVFYIYKLMSGSIGFIISIIAGIIVYTVCIFLFKVDESVEVFNMIQKKIKKH